MAVKRTTDGQVHRALVLDGSRADDREARLSREAIEAELGRQHIGYTSYALRDLAIAPCTGCFNCWTKSPGVCAVHDGQDQIIADLARTGLVILITPVTFGGYSSELKKGLDRLIPDLLPFFKRYDGETHHPHRYGTGWELLGVGTLPQGDEEKAALFRDLVDRNSRNMHARRHASCVLIKGAGEEHLRDEVVRALREVTA